MTSPTQKVGYKAEEAAEAYLESQGLKAVERNVHFKTGELDLVMKDKDTLVFVEVRYRKNKRFGSPAETVTRSKQEKLVRTALLYCQKHNITSPWRIDVVAINDIKSSHEKEISWIPSAVTA